jgi:hypothetical protein
MWLGVLRICLEKQDVSHHLTHLVCKFFILVNRDLSTIVLWNLLIEIIVNWFKSSKNFFLSVP